MEIASGFEAVTAWLLQIRFVLTGTRLGEAVAHDTSFPSSWGSWELLLWRMRKLPLEEGQKALLYFWLLSWLITLH